jgi:transposase
MELEKRVKELEEKLSKALQRIEELEVFEKENKLLRKKIEELEKRLKFGNEKERVIPDFVKEDIKHRQKKPGQKVGHVGCCRPLPEKIDEEVEVNKCPDCGTELNGSEIVERYGEEIVFSKRKVTKYYERRGWCSKCKKIKTAQTTDLLPRCRFGMNLMLFVCFQKYGLALTINKIRKELMTYFSIKVSEGEISQILTKLGRVFGKEYEELKQEMRRMSVSYTDDTSWRENGKNSQLWIFINQKIALYKIKRDRSHEVALSVLGKYYDGIVPSDRHSSFNVLEEKTKCKQQKCWAHLLRNSEDLAKYYPEGKYVDKRLNFIFRKSQEGESEEKLLHWIDLIASRTYTSTHVYKFVKSICRKHRENLFRFINNPEVEATNNRAERGLRPLVVIRKISGGTRSKNGTRATEVLSSIIQTNQLQGKSFLNEGRSYLHSYFFNSALNPT